MIDRELRQMFLERETIAPPVEPLASRIRTRAARRDRRIRIRWLVTAVAAVVLVVAAVPTALAGWRGASPVPPGDRQSASPPTSSPTLPPGPLVPAPDVAVDIPVSPGWLPGSLRDPTYATARMDDGLREVGYHAASPKVGDVESVTITTVPAAPSRDLVLPDAPGDGASAVDKRDLRVRGHGARQNTWTLPYMGTRWCTLSWAERPGLWIVVAVLEKTRDMSRAGAARCSIGRRVAEELIERSMALARAIRLTLVPAGYELRVTGTEREMWCPTTVSDIMYGFLCLHATDGLNEGSLGPSFGVAVSVRGHPGRLRRLPRVELVVPGYLHLTMATSKMESSIVDLSDEDMVRMAEAAIPSRPW